GDPLNEIVAAVAVAADEPAPRGQPTGICRSGGGVCAGGGFGGSVFGGGAAGASDGMPGAVPSAAKGKVGAGAPSGALAAPQCGQKAPSGRSEPQFRQINLTFPWRAAIITRTGAGMVEGRMPVRGLYAILDLGLTAPAAAAG